MINWNVEELTGISRPLVSGLTCDTTNRIIYAIESSTNQLIRISLRSTEVNLSRFSSVPSPSAVHVSEAGQLYVADDNTHSVSLVDESLRTTSVIPLGSDADMIRISSTETGPLISWRDCIFTVAQFDMSGGLVWDAVLPYGIVDVYPVSRYGAIDVVVLTGSLDVLEFTNTGNVTNVRNIMNFQSSPIVLARLSERLHVAIKSVLLDATCGPKGSKLIFLCNVTEEEASASCRILLEEDDGLSLLVVSPDAVSDVRLLSNDMLIGVCNLPSAGECWIRSFHIPERLS